LTVSFAAVPSGLYLTTNYQESGEGRGDEPFQKELWALNVLENGTGDGF